MWNGIPEIMNIRKQQEELADLIERHTRTDGKHKTAIPSLLLNRTSALSEPVFSLFEPALCVIAQGSKLIMLGNESYRYNPASYMITSVQLPITGRVIEAEFPYLSFQLRFSPSQVLDIIKDLDPVKEESKEKARRGIAVTQISPQFLDAVLRLTRLLDTPGDIPILAPLFIREILYRVLQDEQGAIIKQFVKSGSQAQRIAEVINTIIQNYDKTINITRLAKQVNMSVSSLHFYFKEFTAMSPLQYQKRLRLQKARSLLLEGMSESFEAGYMVGYESPSQFSREYARMFGLPPISDIARLHQTLSNK